MKKILFISLIVVLLLFVACKKKEGLIEKPVEKKEFSKIEFKDCDKDLSCFAEASSRGEKVRVKISQKDPQTNIVTGESLFESRGKFDNKVVVSQKVTSVDLGLVFSEQEKLVSKEEKPCFDIVKKEFNSYLKKMEGKELICKLEALEMAKVQTELDLNNLMSIAASQSIEQEGTPDQLNPLSVKLKIKQGGLCTGSMLQYMTSAVTDMLELFRKIGESQECKPIVEKGGTLPGMVGSVESDQLN